MILNRRVAMLIALALAPLPVFGQGNSGRGGGNPGNGAGRERGNGIGGKAGGGNSERGGPPPLMGTTELGTVHAWLGVNPSFITQPLPPGMRNWLAQGKPLPPGIARRAVPPGLLGGLPAYPGYEYAIVGTNLVLLAVRTAVVSAILSDAFGR